MSSHEKEQAAGQGISDYIHTAKHLGYDALVHTLEKMDAGERLGRKNPHSVSTERIRLLDMPTQEYISVPVGEFLTNPAVYLSQLPDGDYYFASIVPGIHLAHGVTRQDVIDFAQEFVRTHPDADELKQELYISHNGEPVMSAHIIVQDLPGANADYMEATVGNFNAFHRGAHSPEIIVRRHTSSYEWRFRDGLEATGDWRDGDSFVCNGGVELTRLQMAEQLYRTLHHIPHDGNHFLPGYYEVLFERTPENKLRPAFIEAVVTP